MSTGVARVTFISAGSCIQVWPKRAVVKPGTPLKVYTKEGVSFTGSG